MKLHTNGIKISCKIYGGKLKSHGIIATLLFAYFFLSLYCRDMMLNYEQTGIVFRFSAEFFNSYVFERWYNVLSGVVSIMAYIQNFLTQFYYYPELGTFIIIGLCFLLMFLLKKLFGSWLYGVVSVQAFLFSFCHDNLFWLIAPLILFSATLFIKTIVKAIKKPSKRRQIPQKNAPPPKHDYSLIAIIIFVLLCFCNIFFQSKTKRKLAKAEQMFICGNWEGIANSNTIKFPNEYNLNFEEVSLFDIYKMSLIYTGRALDTFFIMPRPLFPPLYEKIDYKDNSILKILISRFYIDNNMCSEALHLLYDGVVSGDYSPYTICMLLDASFAAGDIKPTKKFISLLDQSIFYRKKAREYREKIKTNNIKPRKGNDSRTDAYTPDKAILMQYEKVLLDSNSRSTKSLFEYANMVRLLYKQINSDTLLREIKNSRNLGYNDTPKAIQEALVIAQMRNGSKSTQQEEEIISPQIMKEAQEYWYYKEKVFFRKGDVLATDMQKYVSGGYFFYYDFVFLTPITFTSSHISEI